MYWLLCRVLWVLVLQVLQDYHERRWFGCDWQFWLLGWIFFWRVSSEFDGKNLSRSLDGCSQSFSVKFQFYQLLLLGFFLLFILILLISQLNFHVSMLKSARFLSLLHLLKEELAQQGVQKWIFQFLPQIFQEIVAWEASHQVFLLEKFHLIELVGWEERTLSFSTLF